MTGFYWYSITLQNLCNEYVFNYLNILRYIAVASLDSVVYYPFAHSRHPDVNSWEFRTGTSQSPRHNPNKSSSVSGNQWSARITLQRNVHAV